MILCFWVFKQFNFNGFFQICSTFFVFIFIGYVCFHYNFYYRAFFKEDFLKTFDCNGRDYAKIAMLDWINSALDSDISQLMTNWLTGILNSFSSTITNSFTEGRNKIKVLKRNSYGYRNFKRFRNRMQSGIQKRHIRGE